MKRKCCLLFTLSVSYFQCKEFQKDLTKLIFVLQANPTTILLLILHTRDTNSKTTDNFIYYFFAFLRFYNSFFFKYTESNNEIEHVINLHDRLRCVASGTIKF